MFTCSYVLIHSLIHSLQVKHLFNFAVYEEESSFYNDETKKVIGRMKEKLNREIFDDFVSLRVKMYSLKTKKEEMKKAKGMKKNIVQKYISHQDYADCLFEERKFMHTMQTTQSLLHYQTE